MQGLASFFVGCARFFVPTIAVRNPELVGSKNCPPYFARFNLSYELLAYSSEF